MGMVSKFETEPLLIQKLSLKSRWVSARLGYTEWGAVIFDINGDGRDIAALSFINNKNAKSYITGSIANVAFV